VVSMYPQLRTDDVLSGSFCSTDGFVDPHLAMVGFMTCAVENGAKLWKGAEVTGIDHDPGVGFVVHSTKGDVSTRTLVNAAGAWAKSVAAFVGVELPVEPLRRMLVPTEPFDEFPHSAPMIIDMSTGFHFRPEGRGFLFAWNDPEETAGFNTNFDPAFVEKILIHAANRAPCSENVAAKRNPASA